MKKIFFAILFLMITGISLSQTAIPKTAIHLKIPGDGGGSKFSVMIYYNPVDGNYYYYNPTTQQSAANTLLQDIYSKSDTSLTRLTSMVVKLTEIINRLNADTTNLNYLSNLSSYLKPFNLRGATHTTISSEIDTVIFTGATTKVKWIVYAMTDSIEASLKGDFSDAQPIVTNTSFVFDNFSPIQFPKGYVRRWGTGTTTYSQSWLAY